MFKKKVSDTVADRMIYEAEEITQSAKNRLVGAVQQVIIKQGVIDLYPEGPDQERAKEDLKKAKFSLLCAIGHYDGRLQEYKNALNKNEEWRETTIGKRCQFIPSHEVIEIVYSNFWKK